MIFKLLTLFFLIVITCSKFDAADYDSKIKWLYNRLQQRFWREDKQFKNPRSPAHMKGLYQSHIHINFIDKKNSYFTQLMRNNPLDDNNMIVTSFVLYSLLQTAQLGTIKIDDHSFSMALETLSSFRDKNIEHGVPQYNFWPQNLVNGTWIAQPTNLLNVANMIPSSLPKPLMFVVQKMGLDIIFALKDLVNVFTIPADNDDSGVNLALLGLLKQTNSTHFNFWKSFNYNIEQYYKRVLKYAYRPFDSSYSQNKFANQIDPRIYYLYHDFLQAKKAQALASNSKPTLILPTTWLLNYQQQINGMIRMPFSNNNVDSTVCANVLFGISSLVLNNQLKLQNVPELEQLVVDTSDLLVYVIQNKIQLRPDLALVYYPSKYDFFWFVSRIINLYKRQQKLYSPFDTIYQKLSNSMKNKGKKQYNQGTQYLIKSTYSSKLGDKYWAQFLGNYANKTRNQDAIFSTSLALNALLDLWTTRKSNKLYYDKDVPIVVVQTIESGVSYLMNNIKPKMKQYNSFFSGSWKSQQTNPYIYPANVHLDKNSKVFSNQEKNINPNNSTFNDISSGMNYLIKGFIQKQEYQKLLQLKWFGYNVPTQFKGFNQSPFPFWSAEPITQVIALSVLSKFMKAKQSILQFNQN